MKTFLSRILLALALAGLAGAGCATQQLTATVAPEADLKAVRKIFVVHQPKDGRGIDKLIADRLNQLGRTATHGERAAAPADVDAFVTYQDRWVWDVTMYMIELNVQLRNPKSDISLASAHAMRTSLVRKSPPEMVEEVLTEMFKKG